MAFNSKKPGAWKRTVIGVWTEFLRTRWMTLAAVLFWVVRDDDWSLLIAVAIGWMAQGVTRQFLSRKRKDQVSYDRFTSWSTEHPWLSPLVDFGSFLLPLAAVLLLVRGQSQHVAIVGFWIVVLLVANMGITGIWRTKLSEGL